MFYGFCLFLFVLVLFVFLFCFVFVPDGDFLSPFVCLYIVFIAAVWANSSLDPLLGWLLTLLPAKSSVGFLWCTEHGITNWSGMSTSIGHSLN